jgi:hypothetical protein
LAYDGAIFVNAQQRPDRFLSAAVRHPCHSTSPNIRTCFW